MPKRLTEKHIVDNIDCGYKIKKDTSKDGIIQGWNKTDAINKLGKLEDVEEELGIDLITLFKVLGNGLYHKTDYGTIEFTNIDRLTFVEGINEYAFEKITGCQCGTNSVNKNWWQLNREVFLLKYYGKKWAITQEELL